MLRWLGSHKDGLTVIFGAVVAIGATYEYLNSRADSRIERAVQILERREEGVILTARIKQMEMWAENPSIFFRFRENNRFSRELSIYVTDKIFRDLEHRQSVMKLAAYYTNASFCALDGICDDVVLCAGLTAEIQRYMELNKRYIAHLMTAYWSGARDLTVGMSEFTQHCTDDYKWNITSMSNLTLECRIGLHLRRLVGWSMGLSCDDDENVSETKYTLEIIEMSSKMLKGDPGHGRYAPIPRRGSELLLGTCAHKVEDKTESELEEGFNAKRGCAEFSEEDAVQMGGSQNTGMRKQFFGREREERM